MSADFDSLADMDVVLFKRKDGNEAEGKLEIGAMQEDGTVAPISSWTDEYAFGTCIEFVVDEENRFPGLESSDIEVVRVLAEDAVGYGSRQVGGGKGPGNPHGEESEPLYYVEERELENVDVVINPELEILW